MVLKAFSALMTPIESVIPVPENYSSEYLRVSAGVTYLGSNAKARAALGWIPRDLEAGLPDALEDEQRRLGRR